MWRKRQVNRDCVYVITGNTNNGLKLDSVFPSDKDSHPILYLVLDKNALHLNIPNGPITIYSSLLKEPISAKNIFDAFSNLTKEIDLKLSHNKNAIRFEYAMILDTVSTNQNGVPLLNFLTDRGTIQIEIPNGEVIIWYNTLPTEVIKGKDIFIAFRRFHKRIGYKRKG